MLYSAALVVRVHACTLCVCVCVCGGGGGGGGGGDGDGGRWEGGKLGEYECVVGDVLHIMYYWMHCVSQCIKSASKLALRTALTTCYLMPCTTWPTYMQGCSTQHEQCHSTLATDHANMTFNPFMAMTDQLNTTFDL